MSSTDTAVVIPCGDHERGVVQPAVEQDRETAPEASVGESPTLVAAADHQPAIADASAAGHLDALDLAPGQQGPVAAEPDPQSGHVHDEQAGLA